MPTNPSFWTQYALFLAKGMTFVLLIAAILALIFWFKKANKSEDGFKISRLNEHYQQQKIELINALDETRKKQHKHKKTVETEGAKPCLFVLEFDGDVEANAVDSLREQISAILQVAEKNDEILLKLESGGGYVHAYGLAASQLQRLNDADLRLTIAVDKIAASGGYMMACTAKEIIAAPFAVIGSIGVVASLPNINRLLKKHDIDYEQHTAGEHKRTLTVFGENTEEARKRFKEELSITHQLFKDHIKRLRPELAIESLATGETWYGTQALEKGLIDQIGTSDDFILSRLNTHQIIKLEEEKEETLLDKLKLPFLSRSRFELPAALSLSKYHIR